MIKFYSLFWLLSLHCILLRAQAPQGINYQGVAREVSGTPIESKLIGIRISVVRDSPNGAVEYSERHQVTTNPFGLFTLVIGKGIVITGNFPFISWADGNKWVQVEMDLGGGTNYQLTGHQQLMSVPFALYSQYSGSGYVAGAGISIVNNTIVNTGDASATNELQSLTFDNSNNNLSISGGNSVNITQTFGQVLTQGNDAGGRIIANVGMPATSSDVTTKGYVDTAIAARYAFKVSYAFNNSGSTVANQQVGFSGENFDDFNVVSSNQFTVPTGGAGVYIFYVDGTSSYSGVALKARVNFSTSNLIPVKRQISFPNLLAVNDLQTFTLKLSDGDVVDLVVDSNGGGDYVTGFFFGNKL